MQRKTPVPCCFPLTPQEPGMRSGREGAAMHCQGLNSPIRMNWQYRPLAQTTPPTITRGPFLLQNRNTVVALFLTRPVTPGWKGTTAGSSPRRCSDCPVVIFSGPLGRGWEGSRGRPSSWLRVAAQAVAPTLRSPVRSFSYHF